MRNEFCQFGRLKKRRKKSKSLTMYFLKQKPKLWRMSNSFYSIFFFFFRIQNATMMMLMWNNNYRKQKSEKIKKKNYSQKAKESTQQTRQGVHATHYIYSTLYTEKRKSWTTRFSLNFLSVTRLFKITFVCCLYIWYAMHIAQQNLHFECWITYTHLTKR